MKGEREGKGSWERRMKCDEKQGGEVGRKWKGEKERNEGEEMKERQRGE